MLLAETISYSHLERNGITSKKKEAHASQAFPHKDPQRPQKILNVLGDHRLDGSSSVGCFTAAISSSFHELDTISLWSLGHGSDGKESACSAGDPGSILGLGRSPGEGNGHHSTILAWRIPWTEEPDGLQSMGSQRVGHN